MSNAVTLYAMNDLTQMAEAIAQSKLFGMKSWQEALALMLVAQAEGQHPATITQDYDVIQGKACRKTHSVMARFQQMGGKIEWHELTEKVADATFSHPAGGSLRINWTYAQAEKAKLTGKDNWRNYPRAMLRARVIAEGVRAVYPAAIGGMMVVEEAQDITPVPEREMGNVQREVRRDPPVRQQVQEVAAPPAANSEPEPIVFDNDTGEIVEKAAPVQAPAQPTAQSGGLQIGQINHVRNKLKALTIPESEFMSKFGKSSVEEMTPAEFKQACGFLAKAA